MKGAFDFVLLLFASVWCCLPSKKIIVFGGTGKTGSLIAKGLIENYPEVRVICPVRNMKKGRAIFGKDTSRLSLIPFNIDAATKTRIGVTIKDSFAVVSAASYTPEGIIDIAGTYKVDNAFTKQLIDTCTELNVPKFVLLSSLLTNGARSGQLMNPQYLLLNAFGGVLLQKRAAEQHLEKQSENLDWTIIRPGGLTDEAAESPVLYAAQDTLFGGSISRSQVAGVVCAACFSVNARNKIVEIISRQDATQVSFQQGFASIP